eukprot:10836011-Lingulodinium_polyedra.AAC.1
MVDSDDDAGNPEAEAPTQPADETPWTPVNGRRCSGKTYVETPQLSTAASQRNRVSPYGGA